MSTNYDVLERTFLVRLFHNEKVREQYTDDLLPQIFFNPVVRLGVFVIKKLVENNMRITAENVAMMANSPNEDIKIFKRKFSLSKVRSDEITDIIYDVALDSSDKMTGMVYDMLLSAAFNRFVKEAISDIEYWNSYGFEEYQPKIIARCKGVISVNNILHGRKNGKVDQLGDTMELINSDEEYISTSSTVLNSYIGGFTRGYVGAIIAKSSHCKSTWIDYNSVHTLLAGKVDRIDIITPEESAATRWRRVIAMIAKIPTSAMRQKTVKINQAHIDKVRELLGNRLFIHDDVFKYKDIIDLMSSLSTTGMIVLDHLQSIDYPGTGGAMQRMISNIPGIIEAEKRIAKHRYIPIINLSQVNDKVIQGSDRLMKAPRYWDAYGSSVLYQASREYLAFWYPYKDYEDSPISFADKPPSINDIQLAIEKSSFSRVARFMIGYDPERAMFYDTQKQLKRLEKMDFSPPIEKEITQLGLF